MADINLFKNKIRKQDILTISGVGEYNSSNLVGGVKYEQTVNSGTDIVLGSCTCSTIEFELMNLNNLINNLAGKEITWKKRVETSPGVYEDIQMGIFIAEKPVKVNDTRIRVKAYDRMKKFDVIVDDWLKTVSYPITLKNFLLGLCSYVGVTLSNTSFLNDNYPVKFNFLGRNVKGRDILKWIAEIAAKFAIIDEQGQLKLGWYNNIVYSINNSNYYTIKVEDYQVKKIDKLQVRIEENDIGVIVGEGTNAYVIEDNPLLYASTDAEIRPYIELIYNAIKDFTYVPYEIKVNDNPLIKAGNMFTVTTRKGQTFKAVVMSRTMTSGSDIFKATGNMERPVNTSVNTSIKRLRGKANVLERTIENTISRLYDEDTGDLTILTQTVNSFSSRIQSIEANMNFRYQQDTAPENPEIGDVWFSTSNEVFIVNNLLMLVDQMTKEVNYYGNSLNKSYRWNGSEWDHIEDGSITELRMNVSEISQTVDNISLEVSTYDGRIGTLELTANNLTSRIQNAEGDISEIQQTSNTIISRLTSAEGNISQITQTTDALELKFEDITSLDETIQGGVTTISKNGIIITTTNNKAKLEMLASTGYALYTDTGNGLEKKFYVDTNGKIQAKSLVISGDSEFQGVINVGTDAIIGNKLILGNQSLGSPKGIYFTNNSQITSSSNILNIFAKQGMNIYTNNGDLQLGVRDNSGYKTIISGSGGIDIFTQTNLSYDINIQATKNLVLSANFRGGSGIIYYLASGYYSPRHEFYVNSNEILEITSSGVNFFNKIPMNLISPSVQDKSYSSGRGIEFRISNGKLQYKSTHSSTWINLE